MCCLFDHDFELILTEMKTKDIKISKCLRTHGHKSLQIVI